jgi:putative phosphonate metabolism protein
MRYAIYFTPPRDHPLTRTASAWLGRDAFTGLALPHTENTGLALGELAYFTALPRRYGFHATLKAPFRLADGFSEPDLLRMAERLAGEVPTIRIPEVTISRLGAFFAITPAQPNADLNAFAGRVVAVFDKLRAPLSDREFQRRDPDRLTTPQLRNLQNWGYPYVFDEFRFHMTLTGPIDPADRPRVENALVRNFADFLGEPLEIDHIAVSVEGEEGAPFEVHSLFPLAEIRNRRIA